MADEHRLSRRDASKQQRRSPAKGGDVVSLESALPQSRLRSQPRLTTQQLTREAPWRRRLYTSLSGTLPLRRLHVAGWVLRVTACLTCWCAGPLPAACLVAVVTPGYSRTVSGSLHAARNPPLYPMATPCAGSHMVAGSSPLADYTSPDTTVVSP